MSRVPHTSTHSVWIRDLKEGEDIDPITHEPLQEMVHPVQRILNKNGHPDDPSKWTYGNFHDLDSLKRWFSTRMGNGSRFHTSDPCTNLPMDFDAYDDVEIMDLPKELLSNPSYKSRRNYAARSQLALQAGRIGRIPAFSFAMHHTLPSIKGFRRMMAFFSFKTDPRINPVLDWQSDYWRVHPRKSEMNDDFELDYSKIGGRPTAHQSSAEYDAFRVKMIGKIKETFGTPAFYYIRQYWLHHRMDALSDSPEVIDLYNRETEFIRHQDERKGLDSHVFRKESQLPASVQWHHSPRRGDNGSAASSSQRYDAQSVLDQQVDDLARRFDHLYDT